MTAFSLLNTPHILQFNILRIKIYLQSNILIKTDKITNKSQENIFKNKINKNILIKYIYKKKEKMNNMIYRILSL